MDKFQNHRINTVIEAPVVSGGAPETPNYDYATPPKPEKPKNNRRNLILGVTSGVAAIALAGGVALGVGNALANKSEDTKPLDGTSEIDETPIPDTELSSIYTTEDPETGRVPTLFERTDALPESLKAIYSPSVSVGEFDALSDTDQLKLWSWLAQKKGDYNERFAAVNGDSEARAILTPLTLESFSTTGNGLELLNRHGADQRIIQSFFDATDPNMPAKLDLNEISKAYAAISFGGEAAYANQIVDDGTRYNDVDSLALAGTYLRHTSDTTIVAESAVYEMPNEPGVYAKNVKYTNNGVTVQMTFKLVPFENYLDENDHGLVGSPVYDLSVPLTY